MRLPPGLALPPATLAAIHPESRFELPCVVQARLRPGHLVEVGAFTGIFGGHIGTARIGRFGSIAPDCVIGQDEHPTDWLSSSMLQYADNVHGWKDYVEASGTPFAAPVRRFVSSRPVEIGHDVWLGFGAFLRGGVRIGDGAILAAHSVVVKDVPPYTIMGGNPARPIRLRFPERVVERLLALRWWDYEVFRLPDLDFSDVEAAIDRIGNAVAAGRIGRLQPHVVTAREVRAAWPAARRA